MLLLLLLLLVGGEVPHDEVLLDLVKELRVFVLTPRHPRRSHMCMCVCVCVCVCVRGYDLQRYAVLLLLLLTTWQQEIGVLMPMKCILQQLLLCVCI